MSAARINNYDPILFLLESKEKDENQIAVKVECKDQSQEARN